MRELDIIDYVLKCVQDRGLTRGDYGVLMGPNCLLGYAIEYIARHEGLSGEPGKEMSTSLAKLVETSFYDVLEQYAKLVLRAAKRKRMRGSTLGYLVDFSDKSSCSEVEEILKSASRS